MGKSTTAGFFRDLGIPVWDADMAVHRLYSQGGAAVPLIRGLNPDAIVDGSVNRARLRDWIAADKSALKRIETVVHPLVAQDRQTFVEQAKTEGKKLLLVDVPLLFETGGEGYVDAVLVVSAPKNVQESRVMARDGMTQAHFQKILATQMPDTEKRARADYIVETTTLEAARSAVERILDEILNRIETDA